MSAFDEKAVTEAVEKVTSTVVSVGTVRLIESYFFAPVPTKGLGSGLIIDPNGLILTANHVIQDSRRIEVVLPDGKTFAGRLLGADPYSDVAVVKVDAKGLPAPRLGNSDKLKAGQMVLAIGNPLGLVGKPTVTLGVVSALSRTIKSPRGVFEDMIQTDAAINPGNSGGPLINLRGEVVAINTAIIPFAQGIGFAIPINKAKKVSQELLTYGEVRRPWLGVYTVDVTPRLAHHYQLPVEKGILVAEVVYGSPADEAGIRRGDIIISLGGVAADNAIALRKEISKRSIGEKLGIIFMRGTRKLDTTAVLGKRS